MKAGRPRGAKVRDCISKNGAKVLSGVREKSGCDSAEIGCGGYAH